MLYGTWLIIHILCDLLSNARCRAPFIFVKHSRAVLKKAGRNTSLLPFGMSTVMMNRLSTDSTGFINLRQSNKSLLKSKEYPNKKENNKEPSIQYET